ncbi:VOC family protein [Kribbella sancticallisti]|uniref:VOC family protein n=1 Tax=Kribbella sancticallisti TaxID=460087 RepID=UPI003CD0532C
MEPTDTGWGTTSAYVAGPHGVLVELFRPLAAPSGALGNQPVVEGRQLSSWRRVR